MFKSKAPEKDKKINMTISLAFLAPDLVKAAIEGRLPHAIGVILCLHGGIVRKKRQSF